MAADPGLLRLALLLPLLAGLGMSASDALPAPGIHLALDDGFVTMNFSISEKLVHPVYATYNIVLQNVNSSSTERTKNTMLGSYKILFSDLLPGVMYCARVRVYDSLMDTYTPFSEPKCFITPSKALPGNLRVEAVNTRYILKWDWDYEQNPNVTFSVKASTDYFKQWREVKGCENITTLDCNVSGLEYISALYNFHVSVYNSQTGERSLNVVKFNPTQDPVMGPPAVLNMTIQNSDLHVFVEPPEGLMVEDFRSRCTWLYHLEIWRNSTPSEVTSMKESSPHFKMKAVQASTTYCARAHVICDIEGQVGQYSQDYCLTTDPQSYVKELMIGLAFVMVVVVSALLYICLCPFKRYMKHIFYPRSKLPSSIEKFFQDSPGNYIGKAFHIQKEEPPDQCIIASTILLDPGVPND